MTKYIPTEEKETKTVTYWKNGLPITSMMPRERAEQLVTERIAAWINSRNLRCIEDL